MITTLAFRHLLVRRVRALVLLAGFALGVGVMVVLLSVGEAMVAQSRDVSLIGGGEVTILPEGIDVEAIRTGGVGGMFFGIDRARFVTREVLGGPRRTDLVGAVSPVIEQKLLYLEHAGRVLPVRSGGEVPSRAAAVGAGLDVVAGSWRDSPADSAWVSPSPGQLFDEIDHFHLPRRRDSTWAEWHYFNVVAGPAEWWYLTWLVGGDVPDGRWGGRLLVTHRTPGGKHEQFIADVPARLVRFDTTRADVALGPHRVTQRDGRYTLVGTARSASAARRTVRFDLTVVPMPGSYFPPVELPGEGLVSGYVVPALRATATGQVCLDGACRTLQDAPAYHDHNWGTWRDVTWEWGMGQGSRLSLLYGGVEVPAEGAPTGNRFFMALADSFGIAQVLRFQAVRDEGTHLHFAARRGADSVRVAIAALAEHVNPPRVAGSPAFVQIRGRWVLSGTLAGRPVADSGLGFFETFRETAAQRSND